MDNKQFYTVWADAQESSDRDAFISDWSLSSLFLPADDPEAEISPALIEELGRIWDVAHMSFKDLRNTTGLSQVAFAERFCVSRRTVEGWESRSCPGHIRLMLAEILGLLKR